MHPSHHGLGIGTQLLAYGFRTYDLETETLFVPAFPRARKLYAKFGFVEKRVLEVDFADERWGMYCICFLWLRRGFADVGLRWEG